MEKSKSEWKQELTPKQYRILREKGTEAAFTGKYFDSKDAGMYLCAGCGAELFSSETKYDSGSGWPSFYAPVSRDAIGSESDTSHGMNRTEVLCQKCGGHLGHVFPDGPEEKGGNRFCINSGALDFNSKE